MKPASDKADMESIIDDVQEALRWKQILPLLKATREASGPAKFAAIRDAVVFGCKNVGFDLWQSKAFLAFAVMVELSAKDPRILSMLEDLLPPKR